jgi:diaminohydroxyphosphoribosylaminopyrimidine deaminase/5-amino-6-(5-phosphoribosylamino)uracil reductase
VHEAFLQWQRTHPLSAHTPATPMAFMRRALEEASQGWFAARPNPMVGCVLVDHQTQQILAVGHHVCYGQAHAEVQALAHLRQTRAHPYFQYITAYVTLEPCPHHGRTPPCTEALIQAGIPRVVVAMRDPHPKVAGQGIQRLRDAGVAVEVLEDHPHPEAQALVTGAKTLNTAFLWSCQHQKTYVALKIAQSLDGAIATRQGQSQWITGDIARGWVHEMRGGFDAILSTAETVLHDHAQLTVRTPLWDYATQGGRPPIRVILDRRFRLGQYIKQVIPTQKPLLVLDTHDAPTWLVVDARRLKDAPAQGVEALQAQGVELIPIPFSEDTLAPTLGALFERGVHSLWVEAGGRLASALHHQQAVQDYYLTVGPKILGDPKGLIPAWHGTAEHLVREMSDASVLQFQAARALGQDVLLHYQSNATKRV